MKHAVSLFHFCFIACFTANDRETMPGEVPQRHAVDSSKREAELEHWREIKRNQWRIAEEIGMPRSEAEKVWSMVKLEMKFYCPDFMRGMSIALHARQWVEDRNPFHIDAAVSLCGLAGIRPPPALAELLSLIHI